MKKINILFATLFAGMFSLSVQAVEVRDHHQDVIGKDCKTCHDNGIKNYPSDTACLQCHDVDELAETTKRSEEDKWQNPHNNLHYGKELTCIECHGEHVSKEPMCNDCHTFSYDKHKQ